MSPPDSQSSARHARGETSQQTSCQVQIGAAQPSRVSQEDSGHSLASVTPISDASAGRSTACAGVWCSENTRLQELKQHGCRKQCDKVAGTETEYSYYPDQD
jgi:hypothetical protein